ncbi:FAD assembly factor SdhE [Roseitranquillus sediminis]|uniref:FAD assembly factor SdhE n=1 Tax=Roseitranquillus sediminis TaxID=2809051 RepID=UPI001D0BFF4E|nr:succinate dehydrogenase assembly factor 2 [Roseitranquillus sediminis]MBM9595743.1 succinate dehydrogenase assembly factor 2 [Roseitranquillus sediminis]
MRSWRRGIKEMDLILGRFADARLAAMSGEELDGYEALLSENDHDLYAWIAGRAPAPEHLAPLVGRIAEEAGARQG